MKHWWYKKKKKLKPKSPFGGEVKSQEEIQALSKKIKEIEKKELEEFDKNFDNLWQEAILEDTEKSPPSKKQNKN